MTTKGRKVPSQEAVNEYLDALRESGKTNMFGAGAYLERRFKLDRETAREMLGEWMRTFGKRHPATGAAS